ncbi:MAG: sulfotransferase [Candidatus Promineifilaceae bacterium]
MRLLNRARPAKESDSITVVSGLPRSGTSLMMRMLEAGGIPPLTDRERAADGDNPNGYYEFERVKQLPKGDVGWLPEAQGKAVKVISALLHHLPAGYPYRIVFMRRAVEEVLASQRAMLAHRGQAEGAAGDAELAALFDQHLAQVDAWLASRPDVACLKLSYNDLLADPAGVTAELARFLDRRLDAERMVAVVNPSLYRNRQ